MIASISPLSPRARLRLGRTRAKSNICQFFREPKIGKSFPISNFLRLSHQTSILWQNFIDWYIRQSQTYLPLLKDEENFPARITGQEGIVSNDYFKNFPVFVEVCLSFSTKQRSIFYVVGTHYQQVFMRLVSAFRRRRRRLRLNRAGFRNHPWSKSPRSLRPAESWFEVGTMYRTSLSFFSCLSFWLQLALLLASIILMEGVVLVEANCSPNCRQ